MRDSFPIGATSTGQLTFNPHAGDAIMNPPRSPFHIGNPNSISYKAGYYGWPLLFPPAGAEDETGALGGSITDQLQAHVDQAVANFNSGAIRMSPAQLFRSMLNPNLAGAFRGQVIDSAAKAAVSRDPALPSIYVTRPGEFGPDFLDLNSVPGTPQWWDITTPEQWARHLNDYAGFGNGTPLFTR
jgi:hypothetical protein